MKNIRSKSIAALSLVLLLSTPAVQSMETAKGWTVKGLVSSAWATCPSYADTKEFVGAQASELYETAKAHPYITAAIATPVALATTYGIWKAGKATVKGVKASRAEKALISLIEEAMFSHLAVIAQLVENNVQIGTAKVAGCAGSAEFGNNLMVALKQLPASKQAVKDAAESFIKAVVAWDKSATFKKSLREVRNSVNALEKAGLQVSYKPSLKERVSAQLPSVRTIANAAAVSTIVATPLVAYGLSKAYENGAFNNVINTVSNLNFAGRFMQTQQAIAPASNSEIVTEQLLNQ